MKKSLLLILLLCMCEVAFAYDYSGISIVNKAGVYPSYQQLNLHTSSNTVYWPVSSELDSRDFIVEGTCRVNGGKIYSIAEGEKLIYDYRPCDSVAPFQLRLYFCEHDATEETPNLLWVNYYVDEGNETFDDKSIYLVSDRLRYGYAIDVRRVIEIGCVYGGGEIHLKPIPAGSYNSSTNPYGYAGLYIGTYVVSDFDGDGVSTLNDYAVFAADWLKPQGKYRGDISGEEGIPDGVVDYRDLSILAGRMQ